MSENLHLIIKRTHFLEVINSFASNLLKVNTTSEVVWLVAKHAIAKLGFVDCVVYLKDQDGNLFQAAAHGPKNPIDCDINNPIILKPGEGISGAVAQSGVAEIVDDTSIDSRYREDDQFRYSEITVPILLNDEVIGVIDSEHPDKGYYSKEHLEILETIASMTAVKLEQTKANEKVKFRRDELEKAVNERTIELEKIAAQLRESLTREKELSDLKSRFVSTASHQFRTPLTVIRANIGLLKLSLEGGITDSKFEHITDRIDREIDRMTDLMDDVLTLEKIGSGFLNVHVEEVDLIELLQRVVDTHNEIQNDGRSMQLTHSGKPYDVMLDPKLMEHALSNIISNAFKYSEGKHEPKVHLNFSNHQVRIEVLDYGKGVSGDELRKIFDPFYRGSNVTDISGTGMGMSIAKEYIELNKGTIMVESALDEWTRFTIILSKSFLA